ncbi:MAG: thioredoxin family protein [Spirochaetales bacterium]|nr:thioredoxin family protein [Spirochaetales bacterium]
MPFKEKVTGYERFLDIIAVPSQFQLFYFTHPDCGVCHVVKPNVEALLERHPQLEGYHVDLADDPRIGGQTSVFMVPALLLFRDGRELFREAKYIVIDVIEPQLERIIDNFT